MSEFSDDILSRIPRVSEAMAVKREQERINFKMQREEDERRTQEQLKLESRARAMGLEVVELIKKHRLLSISLYESRNRDGVPTQQMPRNSSSGALHHLGYIGRLWPLYIQEQTIYHDIPGYRPSTKREQISVSSQGDITSGIGAGESFRQHKIIKNVQPSDIIRDGELRAAFNPQIMEPLGAIKLMETDEFKDNLAKIILDSTEQANEFPPVYFHKQGRRYETTGYWRAEAYRRAQVKLRRQP